MSNPENSVNGNAEIPETASNSPDTNPNAFGARWDYFAGMTRGRIYERERIIKIIEKRRDYDCSSALCKKHGLLCIYCQADNELIEIIKGEQK